MNKLYIIIIIILLIIIFTTNIFKKEENILIEKPLKQDETYSVNINNKTNTIITQERTKDNSIKVKEIFIPEESKYEIITSTITNKNEIKYNTKGFSIIPNLSISYTDQLSFGLGLRLFYWNEFGIISHINYFLNDKNVSFSVGIDYRLYKLKLKNLAIGLSYDTHKSIKGQINLYLS